MKTFSEYSHEQLQIVQPSIWKRSYELRTPDAVLMTMTYPKWYSTTAVVEGFGERWEITRPSIWRSNLEIKKTGNQMPFAKFIPEKWGRGGVFHLPNGERIHYVFGIWKGTNELHSQLKQRIVVFKQESIWSSKLNVIFEQYSDLLEKNPWVVMAVKYMIAQRKNNSGAA